MLLLAICILGLGCALCWFLIPDTCAREEDDLPALGDSIDRAIALAAALPPEGDQSDLLDSKEKVDAMAERILRNFTTPQCRHNGVEADCPPICTTLYGSRYAEVVHPN